MVTKSYDIRGFTKPKKYKLSELSNETLGDLLSVFFDKKIESSTPDQTNIVKEFKVEYFDQTSQRKSHFIIDYFLTHKETKIAFEYDGPEHYNNVNKIERDQRKKKKLLELGYKVICVPYYLQLTKDIAKHFFSEDFDVYSDGKYSSAVERIYKTLNEEAMLAHGWHTTSETPANFVEKGIRRFLEEVGQYPSSVRCQLVHSLNLYIKRSNGKMDLIIPTDHIGFSEFMKHKPNKLNLQRFFASDVFAPVIQT